MINFTPHNVAGRIWFNDEYFCILSSPFFLKDTEMVWEPDTKVSQLEAELSAHVSKEAELTEAIQEANAQIAGKGDSIRCLPQMQNLSLILVKP